MNGIKVAEPTKHQAPDDNEVFYIDERSYASGQNISNKIIIEENLNGF